MAVVTEHGAKPDQNQEAGSEVEMLNWDTAVLVWGF